MSASGGPSFVQDLAVVLGVAGVTAGLARRLGQSPIVGYLAAGFLVGPHIPVPLFADQARVQGLAEFGVVLVMFAVGLEFRFARLLALLPRAGLTASVQIGALGLLGVLVGERLGFDGLEQVFLGAGLAISSTMVVTRVFEGTPVDARSRDLVLGVLVVQDVVAVVLIAVLTAVAHGAGLSATEIGVLLAELFGALLALGGLGLLIVPGVVRRTLATGSPELAVVGVGALAFGFAGLAAALGYSAALGAFLGGVTCAESGLSTQIEHLLRPVRDLFAAIFFVSIGMVVDPLVALGQLPAVAVLTPLVVLGQLGAVSLAGVLSGNGLRASITAGLSLGQVGEFGFLLAAIGVAGGAGPELPAVLVSVALITAFTTPIAVRSADRVVHAIDHVLPHRVQRLLSLYEAWFERLRTLPERSPLGRLAGVIALDAVAVAGLSVMAALWAPSVRGGLERAGVAPGAARWVLPVAVLGVIVPLAVAAVRSTRALATRIAADGVPGAGPGAQAARALVEATVQLVVLLAVGLPVAAVIRPFLGPWGDLLGLGPLLGLWGISRIWRRAGDVEATVRSGAHDLMERLVRAPPTGRVAPAPPSLPGLDGVRILRLEPGTVAVGRTLAELDLRVVTGASVVAIRGPDREVVAPTGHERLQAGEWLGLLGTEDAVKAACALLSTAADQRPTDNEAASG